MQQRTGVLFRSRHAQNRFCSGQVHDPQAEGHDIASLSGHRGENPSPIYHKRILPTGEETPGEGQAQIFNLLQSTDTLYVNEETIRKYTDPALLFPTSTQCMTFRNNYVE
jgi:hypothetical protein